MKKRGVVSPTLFFIPLILRGLSPLFVAPVGRSPEGRYRRYLSLREGSGAGQIGAPGWLPFPLAK